MEHREYERMIESHLAGALPEDRIERLHDHLRECTQCARLYERYVDAEKVLCGSPEAISVLQRDRVEARLLGNAQPRPWLADHRLQLAFAAAATAALVLFTVIPPDEFSARGGGSLSHEVELRALAIEPKADGGFAVHPAADRILGRGDHLRLLYQNSSDLDRITVELVGDRRVTLIEDEPIGRALEAKLGNPIPVGDWPKGEVQIRAVFFKGENRAPAGAPASDGDGWSIRTVATRVELP
jgi:hypothetical protein